MIKLCFFFRLFILVPGSVSLIVGTESQTSSPGRTSPASLLSVSGSIAQIDALPSSRWSARHHTETPRCFLEGCQWLPPPNIHCCWYVMRAS
jgi:hypothetical protein